MGGKKYIQLVVVLDKISEQVCQPRPSLSASPIISDLGSTRKTAHTFSAESTTVASTLFTNVYLGRLGGWRICVCTQRCVKYSLHTCYALTLNINCPMSEILSFADPDARLKQCR